MKSLFPFSVIAACVVVVGFGVSAQTMDGHGMTTPQELKWGPAPPGLPPNAQAAVLLGDPGKAGVYVVRLKASKGYFIPPHTHPTQEVVTVISGTMRVGLGNAANRDQTKALPAGGLFVAEPGHVHYVYVDEETVIQANGVGPFVINYVNPSDDPRGKK